MIDELNCKKIQKVEMNIKFKTEISLSGFNRASTPLNFPLGLFSIIALYILKVVNSVITSLHTFNKSLGLRLKRIDSDRLRVRCSTN